MTHSSFSTTARSTMTYATRRLDPSTVSRSRASPLEKLGRGPWPLGKAPFAARDPPCRGSQEAGKTTRSRIERGSAVLSTAARENLPA